MSLTSNLVSVEQGTAGLSMFFIVSQPSPSTDRVEIRVGYRFYALLCMWEREREKEREKENQEK